MQLRIKVHQSTEECNVYRCTKLPVGHYSGIGYLCHKHTEKAAKAEDEGTLELKGAPLKYPQPEGETPQLSENGPTTEETKAVAKKEDWQAEVKEETADLEEALEMVLDFELETDEDVAFATDELANVKGQWKRLEEQRKKITKPMNQALSEVNALFKAPQTLLKKLEATWKGKLTALKARRQEEQRQLIAAAQQTTDLEETHETLTLAADTTMPETPGVSYRTVWKFEVENEDEIPRDYLTPDLVLIGKVVGNLKSKTKIPGIRVWAEEVVASRSN